MTQRFMVQTWDHLELHKRDERDASDQFESGLIFNDHHAVHYKTRRRNLSPDRSEDKYALDLFDI